MMAANRMNPTAMPLVCRPVREYASSLTAIPPRSQRTTDCTMAPAGDADITPFGMSCAGGRAAARAPARLGMGLDHQFDKLEGDTQQSVTFEIEPSRQPMLVAFSSCGRC
jgi:hypothetical protein